MILPGISKCPGDQLKTEPFSPLRLSHLCMPDRHPPVAIRFEFQVADLPVLFNLEPASGDLG